MLYYLEAFFAAIIFCDWNTWISTKVIVSASDKAFHAVKGFGRSNYKCISLITGAATIGSSSEFLRYGVGLLHFGVPNDL